MAVITNPRSNDRAKVIIDISHCALTPENDIEKFMNPEVLMDGYFAWSRLDMSRFYIKEPFVDQWEKENHWALNILEYLSDDGKNPEGWSEAEIVLTGVSRVGKTPLSMYLAVLGWKVANVPLVMGISPPLDLFHLNPNRVVGLTIDPTKLLMHRQQRQRRLGTLGNSPYADPVKLFEEVEVADRIFARGGFLVLDVTDKPIEASADDVIKLITRHTEGKRKRSTGLP